MDILYNLAYVQNPFFFFRMDDKIELRASKKIKRIDKPILVPNSKMVVLYGEKI